MSIDTRDSDIMMARIIALNCQGNLVLIDHYWQLTLANWAWLILFWSGQKRGWVTQSYFVRPLDVRDKNSEASHVSSPPASVNRNIMGGTKISFLSPFVVIALCYGSGQYLWISPQGEGGWWRPSLISPYLCIHYNWTFDRYLWKHSDIWGEVYTIHFISPVGGNEMKLEGIQVSFYFNFRLLTEVKFVFVCIL